MEIHQGDLIIDNEWQVAEQDSSYWNKGQFIFKEETGLIIGICMEVHRELGPGFLEAVYKESLEYEFNRSSVLYEREKLLKVKYKHFYLERKYNCDFLMFNKIILEVKAQNEFSESNFAQTLNYMASGECPVGLLVNFGQASLRFKRLILTPKNKKQE